MGDVGNPEAGSKSTTTKFRVALMGLPELDLPVAVAQGPDTTVPHSSDILHLKMVSKEFILFSGIAVLHAAYGSSAPAVVAAWAGA
jgi:hypothetical protein